MTMDMVREHGEIILRLFPLLPFMKESNKNKYSGHISQKHD